MADLAKLVDELSSLTVLEAAELSKLLEEKWGVSAAAPVAVAAAAPGAAAAPVAEAQTEFTVILAKAGEKKINVIKEIRKICEATTIPIIASGGVASLNDIENLLELRDKGLIGIITGKAIYEGTLDLTEAIKLCSLNE